MALAQFPTVILSIPSAVRKEREAARRATQIADEMKEQLRAKDEEIRRIVDAPKEFEAKWKKGIHSVEWPSRGQYEVNKRRFYNEERFHLATNGTSGSDKSSSVNAIRDLWDEEGAGFYRCR
ncbi:hypothetical protein ARMGADRAFT_1022640 [Armillaria gallica]|uniref:Uncharacterized protein n=1 Tax=Armillaria gallica TaxID=47427 RepID=A0A2H3E9P9_ARMGA|nr:hypothetical protein ARMGADRAFT_1022640 [Armillaria gallica]